MKKSAFNIANMMFPRFFGRRAESAYGRSAGGVHAVRYRGALIVLVVAVAVLLGAPVRSGAALTGDFVSYNYGYLDWAGGEAGLVGGLEVQTVTLPNSQTLSIDSGSPYGSASGILTFNSGNFLKTGSWTFAAGGSFSLIGGITSLTLPSDTTLLSGTFGQMAITVHQLSGGAYYDVVSGTFAGALNPILAAHYGLSSSAVGGQMNFSFLVSQSLSPEGFSVTSPNATVDDPPAPAVPAPVPPSLLLLLPGLFGIGAIRKRFGA